MSNQTTSLPHSFFRIIISLTKSFILLLVLSANILYAQENDKPAPFSIFEVGVYGGINFETTSEIGGVFFLEGKTNIISNLNLKLSLGYYKSIMPVNYTVKTSGETTIDSVTYYSAGAYDVTKKTYDVFPFSLGLQYVFKSKIISPYLIFDASYNIISGKIVRTGGYVWSYLSYDDVPDEFKNEHTEIMPDNSFGLAIGFGGIYYISKNINLDLRYYYKFDSEIIDTHNIVAGISF